MSQTTLSPTSDATLLQRATGLIDVPAAEQAAQHRLYVAIIGDDTPHFRAEQTSLTTDQCRFLLDRMAGVAWLAATPTQGEAHHG